MDKIVSVLIPTRNRNVLAIKAIRSALTQTYTNIEVIVTDNSDTRELEQQINNLGDGRIKYYKNHENIGPILNWRKALEIARGEYCLILPDDDFIINPFYIEDAVKALEDEAVGLVITDCVLSYPRVNKVGVSGHSGYIKGQAFIRNGMHIPHIGNVFRRQLALSLNAFNTNDILWSDIELWRKIMSKVDAYCYNTPSILYLFHTDNIVLNMSRSQLIENSRFIRESVSEFADNKLIVNLLVRYFLTINSISKVVDRKFLLSAIKINNANEICTQIFLKYYLYLFKQKARSGVLFALSGFRRS